MKWYKYRERFSYGFGAWQYIEIPADSGYPTDREYLKALINDSDSEHYRGVEYFKIQHPPRIFIEREIKLEKELVKDHLQTVKRLQALLKTIPVSNGPVHMVIYMQVRSKKLETWATLELNHKKIYKGKKTRTANKAEEKARNWCEKNKYDIVSRKSIMVKD